MQLPYVPDTFGRLLAQSFYPHRAAALVLYLCASVLYGQFVSGSLVGRVVDPSGAPIEDAVISLVHTQTAP